jgi:hypothetical protein
MKTNLKGLGCDAVLQHAETGILPFEPNKPLGPKNFKRVRICLRCHANLPTRHKCEKCGLEFHDGPLLGWLKKLWGISPR